MGKLGFKKDNSVVDELVALYYSIRQEMKSGYLNFRDRASRVSDLIFRSDQHGIYFYRRILDSANPRTHIYNDQFEFDRDVISLASNDYLNFSQHPEVIAESIRITQEYGIGSGSVPMLAGTMKIHKILEQKLTSFLGYEACLLFSSGYIANYGVFSALLNSGDVAILDTSVHASIIDGCQNADSLYFIHNDMESLERTLIKAQNFANKLIVVDGVYSMDGDLAKMDQILELANKYDANVAVDDAHGIGVMGDYGKGTQHHFNLHAGADLVTGSFGKALAGVGGFVCGRREWIKYFELLCRPFLFSSSIPPAVAGALIKQIDLLESGQAPLEELRFNTDFFRNGLKSLGYKVGKSQSPIIPVLIKNESKVLKLCGLLHEKGILVNPIVYPVVSKSKSRLRVSITAGLSQQELDYCLKSFEECGQKAGVI